MAEEFNIYTAKVSDLSDTVATQAARYLEKIDEVTDIVNKLGSEQVWGGPTYETFKSSYYNNLDNLQELNTVLKELSGKLSDTASEAATMINKINSSMM